MGVLHTQLKDGLMIVRLKKPPIFGSKYLLNKDLDLTPTLDGYKTYKGSEFVIITPTIYEDVTDKIDTSSVELVTGVSSSSKDIIGSIHLALEYL